MPMTYQPKIEGVKDGTIRQTTRIFNPDNPKEVGDKLLPHGWAGRPYRSTWDWRRSFKVVQIIDMMAFSKMVGFLQDPVTGQAFADVYNYPWFASEVNHVAKLDGILPATGLEFKSVLEAYHGRFHDFKPVHFQVVRW